MTTAHDALAYASKGFAILPCHAAINGCCTCGGRNPNCKPGKHPLTPHGLKLIFDSCDPDFDVSPLAMGRGSHRSGNPSATSDWK
jgi:hypothetical protein